MGSAWVACCVIMFEHLQFFSVVRGLLKFFGLLEQTVVRLCSGLLWLAWVYSLEQIPSLTLVTSKTETLPSVVWGPMEFLVYLSRLLFGPARASCGRIGFIPWNKSQDRFWSVSKTRTFIIIVHGVDLKKKKLHFTEKIFTSFIKNKKITTKSVWGGRHYTSVLELYHLGQQAGMSLVGQRW